MGDIDKLEADLAKALWLPAPKHPDSATAQGWNSCLAAIQRQRERMDRSWCSECVFWVGSEVDQFGRRVCTSPSSQRFQEPTGSVETCPVFKSRHPTT